MKKILKSFFNPGNGDAVALQEGDFFIYLPTLSKDGKRPELNHQKLARHLSGFSIGTPPLLRECLRYLKELNYIEVNPEDRLKVTDVVIDNVGQHITGCYKKYGDQHCSVPEDHLRKSELSQAISLVNELIVSYKHTLNHYYTGAGAGSSDSVEKAYCSAVRVLELMRWSQRLLSLRYKKVSSRDWKDINQIFFAMMSIGDVTRSCQAIPGMHYFESSNNFERSSSSFNVSDHTTSLLHLFVNIHILGLMDVISWPVHMVHIADAYFDFYADKVGFVSEQDVSPGQYHVLVYQGQNFCASFEGDLREKQKNGFRILLDLEQLNKQVQSDFGKSRGKHQPAGVDSVFPEMLFEPGLLDLVTALELMNKYLHRNIRMDERKAYFGNQGIRIYPGFFESYKQIHTRENKRGSGKHEDPNLRDLLAQSSTETLNGANEEESSWRVVNEGRGGLLVNMLESDHCDKFIVSQLVAYGVGFMGDKDVEIQLGYVKRLQRCREKEVEIAIVKLSSYLECAAVEVPDKEGELLPAFLIRNLDNEWQLIFQPGNNPVSGMSLVLRRKGEKFPVLLDAVSLPNHDFIIMSISSPDL